MMYCMGIALMLLFFFTNLLNGVRSASQHWLSNGRNRGEKTSSFYQFPSPTSNPSCGSSGATGKAFNGDQWAAEGGGGGRKGPFC